MAKPWTFPVAVRDALESWDRVLICKHYWENHERAGFLHYITGGKVTRDDGTTENVRFTLFCDECRNSGIPLKELDFHEWVWVDKKMWLADSIGTPDGPRQAA